MPSSQQIFDTYITEAKSMPDSAIERFGFSSDSLMILTELAQLLTEATEEFIRLQRVIQSNFEDVDMKDCNIYVETMKGIVDTARQLAKTINPFKIKKLIQQLSDQLNGFSTIKGKRSCIEVTDPASCAFAEIQLFLFEQVANKLRDANYDNLPYFMKSKIQAALESQLVQTTTVRIPYLQESIRDFKAAEAIAAATTSTSADVLHSLTEAPTSIEITATPPSPERPQARVVAAPATSKTTQKVADAPSGQALRAPGRRT